MGVLGRRADPSSGRLISLRALSGLNNGKELVVDYRPNKAPNYHHPLREEVELLDPYKLRGILMDKAL
ncbi:unnamed protein product [Boreogadus saida]